MDDDEIRVDTAAPAPPLLERLGFPAGVAFWRESLIVVAVVAPLLTFVYRLYDAHLKVPFNYTGDALGTATYTKTMIENGWYFSSPRLGAPFVTDWRDFPVGGENLHWVALKVLGTLTGNYAVAMNLYFIASFFLIALTAYFVARYLRLRVAVALVVGVLYAFLPYHAFRNVAHIARGAYYIVPVAVLVLLWAADYRKEFLSTDGERTRWRRGRVLAAVVVAVVLGASDTQNAAFMVSFLAVFMLVNAIRDRSWRPLALLVLLSAVAMGSLMLNNVPYLLARHENGANLEAGKRILGDQDYFALRPVNLVLPAEGHRIGALASIASDSADSQSTNSETEGTPLGFVGAVGLLVSLGAVVAVALGLRRRTETGELLARLGILNVVAILIGAIGGFAFLLALAGFGQYRTWNRVSLFIAFASLVATGLLLERGCVWLRGRVTRQSAFTTIVAVASGVLIVGGALDQVTPKYVPSYATVAAQFDRDATFFHGLEQHLPRGAMVFQLPVATFPEAGAIWNMGDYSEFAGYLHTRHLRWSYGGMKGRPDADWLRNLATCDPRVLVTQIAAAGFQGAVIDTSGYPDGATAFLADVTPLVGAPRRQSPDGHLQYVDLTALRSRLTAQVGADTAHAWRDDLLGTTVRWKGFSGIEPACGDPNRWAVQPSATMEVTNRTGRSRSMLVSTDFSANPKSSHITVRGPGFTRQVALVDGRGHFEQPLTLAPGTSRLRFTVTGPRVEAPNDPRQLWFALVGPTAEAGSAPTLAQWAHGATATGSA